MNPFNVSTSNDGTTFDDSFDGVNTAGTTIGVAEEFDFPTNANGRYVRFTPMLTEDQWMSMCEVSSMDRKREGESGESLGVSSLMEVAGGRGVG